MRFYFNVGDFWDGGVGSGRGERQYFFLMTWFCNCETAIMMSRVDVSPQRIAKRCKICGEFA